MSTAPPQSERRSIAHPADTDRDGQRRLAAADLASTIGNAGVGRVLRSTGAGRSDGRRADLNESVARAIEQRRGGGAPLPGGVQGQMEGAFGEDFSGVRVHTDAAAHRLSEAVQARAFTVGSDVFFARGAHNPASTMGKKLLAHELTHVVQQAGALARTPSAVSSPAEPAERRADAAAEQVVAGKTHTRGNGFLWGQVDALAVQRDEEDAPIAANAVLPFDEGSQIQIDQLLSETLFGLLGSVDPATATTLEVVRGQRATVTFATAELVEARLNQRELTLAQGSYRDVRVRLARRSSGNFDFEIVGETGTPPARTAILARRNLTATRRGGAIVLSSGSGTGAVPQLRISPVAGGGVDLEVFKQSFIEEIPDFARRLVPDRIEVLRLAALPPASAGTAAVERAAEELSRRAAARRRTPRHQLGLGAGMLFGEHARFLLQGSWQYHFQPSRTAGSFLQVPLAVAIEYAPSSEVLGRVSTGVGTSLSSLDIPLNLRVTVGGAAGQVLGPEVAGERSLVPAAGITLGAGAGVELGRWRIHLDYDHLFNLLPGTDVPGVGTVTVGGGIAF